MAATKTQRREFLQLANSYEPAKHNIAGFYISEKLDGTRAFWDGGLTRGLRVDQVPWASISDPKTGNRKAKIKTHATGLWSRYGNPIMAPDSYLNGLPCCPLDGELWAGRGKFQLTRSICAGDAPDPRFDQIGYAVYSSPSLTSIFATGLIKNANFLRNISVEECEAFVLERLKDFQGDYRFVPPRHTFDQELLFLRDAIQTQNDQCFLHQQVKLPNSDSEAMEAADDFLEKVLSRGGEGCVIRDPQAIWTPKRHSALLKFKPYEDAEAKIIAYVAGREGKQGNVLGKIGALIVQFRNIQFEIGSGLTFEERAFKTEADTKYAKEHPGELMPPNTQAKHFKVGQEITFKYRELSDDGIPKEGRFWRNRGDE